MTMRRQRAAWKTIETCKSYQFQINTYNEYRIVLINKVFRTFSGQNAIINAKNTGI